MTEPDATPEAKPRARTRRWFLGIAGGLAGTGIAYGLGRGGFRLWMGRSLPENAPNIAFSLDDTWLNRLGITDTTYQQAMTRAAGRLVRLTPESVEQGPALQSSIENFLEREAISGVLLTGGGDVDPALYGGDADEAILVNRARDDFEIALIHAAKARGLPILGICRGCQILNVAFGGTLRNLRDDDELNDVHFSFGGHALQIREDSRLRAILGMDAIDEVLSFHGQAVDQPGGGVRVAATGPQDVIEAIEVGASDTDWIVGVQWHPEMAPGNPLQDKLFAAFVRHATQFSDMSR